MQDTALFIASMCLELENLAALAGQPLLVHLLRMARLEADQEAAIGQMLEDSLAYNSAES